MITKQILLHIKIFYLKFWRKFLALTFALLCIEEEEEEEEEEALANENWIELKLVVWENGVMEWERGGEDWFYWDNEVWDKKNSCKRVKHE